MSTIERPRELSEFVGQNELVSRLRIVMRGARARDALAPHVLLSGPAGTGKTTLAGIVARELGAKLVTVNGPSLRRPGDLAAVLADFDKDATTVLFVDEIHRIPTVVEETLYEAMEDRTLSILIGKNEAARAVTLALAPFVVVGATTKPGALSQPLRDRFGFHGVTTLYGVGDLSQIVAREWERQGHTPDIGAALVTARAAKGTPRVAIHLATRVLDVCALREVEVTQRQAREALSAFGIDGDGLDEIDRKILAALTGPFKGRAVGLLALAQALDMDPMTIEREHEGALVRSGYMVRTPSGRMATAQAFERSR